MAPSVPGTRSGAVSARWRRSPPAYLGPHASRPPHAYDACAASSARWRRRCCSSAARARATTRDRRLPPRPSRTDEGTPLADVDTTSLVVRRAPFCDLVDRAAVARALGVEDEEVPDVAAYGNGERTQLTDKVKDVAHEYGCTWAVGGQRGSGLGLRAARDAEEGRGTHRRPATRARLLADGRLRRLPGVRQAVARPDLPSRWGLRGELSRPVRRRLAHLHLDAARWRRGGPRRPCRPLVRGRRGGCSVLGRPALSCPAG